MKKLLLLAVVLVAFTACAPAPPPVPVVDTAAEEVKLKADALSWFELYNKGDVDGVANLYAEDALLMPPNAPAQTGRPAIRNFFATDIAATKAGGLTLRAATVTGVGVSGDSGWISGTFVVLDASGKTIDTGKYMSVHKKVGGSWPYTRDIWNMDSAAPAPPPPAKGK